ncbi:unnamed protein product [Symbiodinium sp. CCMP2592]|nr:unnamed protein product [Symbiodinium sp. CCMP2592]
MAIMKLAAWLWWLFAQRSGQHTWHRTSSDLRGQLIAFPFVSGAESLSTKVLYSAPVGMLQNFKDMDMPMCSLRNGAWAILRWSSKQNSFTVFLFEKVPLQYDLSSAKELALDAPLPDLANDSEILELDDGLALRVRDHFLFWSADALQRGGPPFARVSADPNAIFRGPSIACCGGVLVRENLTHAECQYRLFIISPAQAGGQVSSHVVLNGTSTDFVTAESLPQGGLALAFYIPAGLPLPTLDIQIFDKSAVLSGGPASFHIPQKTMFDTPLMMASMACVNDVLALVDPGFLQNYPDLVFILLGNPQHWWKTAVRCDAKSPVQVRALALPDHLLAIGCQSSEGETAVQVGIYNVTANVSLVGALDLGSMGSAASDWYIFNYSRAVRGYVNFWTFINMSDVPDAPLLGDVVPLGGGFGVQRSEDSIYSQLDDFFIFMFDDRGPPWKPRAAAPRQMRAFSGHWVPLEEDLLLYYQSDGANQVWSMESDASPQELCNCSVFGRSHSFSSVSASDEGTVAFQFLYSNTVYLLRYWGPALLTLSSSRALQAAVEVGNGFASVMPLADGGLLVGSQHQLQVYEPTSVQPGGTAKPSFQLETSAPARNIQVVAKDSARVPEYLILDNMIYRMGGCPDMKYGERGACKPCPAGLVSLQGSTSCAFRSGWRVFCALSLSLVFGFASVVIGSRVDGVLEPQSQCFKAAWGLAFSLVLLPVVCRMLRNGLLVATLCIALLCIASGLTAVRYQQLDKHFRLAVLWKASMLACKTVLLAMPTPSAQVLMDSMLSCGADAFCPDSCLMGGGYSASVGLKCRCIKAEANSLIQVLNWMAGVVLCGLTVQDLAGFGSAWLVPWEVSPFNRTCGAIALVGAAAINIISCIFAILLATAPAYCYLGGPSLKTSVVVPHSVSALTAPKATTMVLPVLPLMLLANETRWIIATYKRDAEAASKALIWSASGSRVLSLLTLLGAVWSAVSMWQRPPKETGSLCRGVQWSMVGLFLFTAPCSLACALLRAARSDEAPLRAELGATPG